MATSSSTPVASSSPDVVFERILQRQLEDIGRIAREVDDPGEALTAILRHHLAFSLEAGDHLAAWKQEFRHLPAEDAGRLRRMQRLYVEEWVNVVVRVRPDLSDGEARAAVHATMALLQSVSARRSGLPPEEVAEVLCSMALAALQDSKPKPGPSDSVLT
jgi:Tetracyclin repressor-like, C-terminal domain